MLELKNVKKFYGDFLALEDISFKLESKGVVGLLGVNGAGKTTLMRILSAYFEPDEGDYLFNGLDVVENSESFKKEIGYLPDTPPLYLEMTVFEYLHFCCDLKNIKNIGDEIKRVSALVSIDGRLKEIAGSLSKGYRQRLGIAMSILGDPKLIILDEPLVGLDPNQIKEMRLLISNLGKERLVIFSSHILSEVEAISEGIIMLEKGKIKENTTEKGSLRKSPQKEIFLIEIENNEKDFVSFIKAMNESRIQEIRSLGPSRYEIIGSSLSSIRQTLLKKAMDEGFLVKSFSLKEDSLEDLFHP